MNQILLEENSSYTQYTYGTPLEASNFKTNNDQIYKDDSEDLQIKTTNVKREEEDALDDSLYLSKKSSSSNHLDYQDIDYNKENFPPYTRDIANKSTKSKRVLTQKVNDFNNVQFYENEHSFNEIIHLSIKEKNHIAQMERERKKQSKLLMLKKEQRERKRHYSTVNNFNNTTANFNAFYYNNNTQNIDMNMKEY